MADVELIEPDWPAPAAVRAVATTRSGGISRGPYASLNLGTHVGDNRGHVGANRGRLTEAAGLPATPVWLNQVHGTRIADPAGADEGVTADGATTVQPGVVCVVLTADCLPVLICDRAGQRVAAAHAGWRGLAGGVVEQALSASAAATIAKPAERPVRRGSKSQKILIPGPLAHVLLVDAANNIASAGIIASAGKRKPAAASAGMS